MRWVVRGRRLGKNVAERFGNACNVEYFCGVFPKPDSYGQSNQGGHKESAQLTCASRFGMKLLTDERTELEEVADRSFGSTRLSSRCLKSNTCHASQAALLTCHGPISWEFSVRLAGIRSSLWNASHQLELTSNGALHSK